MANLRLGLARPTADSAQDLPLSERFFGGGSFTVRGVEPDMLGDIQRTDSLGNKLVQPIPLGGQGLVVVNLEYRFPLKLEYAADWKRILGRPRTQDERDTQLKSLLISAGFQF